MLVLLLFLGPEYFPTRSVYFDSWVEITINDGVDFSISKRGVVRMLEIIIS